MGNAIAHLSVPTALQMQKEISALPCSDTDTANKGIDQHYHAILAISSNPAEILLALLSFQKDRISERRLQLGI